MYKNKKVFLCIVFISIAVCLCYANIFNAPFIFDDVFLIEEIQKKSLWELMLPSSGLRPFYKLSFALNYYWTGQDTWSYHLVNILIHALNSILIFAIFAETMLLPICRKKFNKKAVYFAFAAALIWAVHPLNTQAVTYLSQRCEIMMTLFYLLSWWCIIKSRDSKKTVYWQLSALVFFVLGLGSKEAMISAPLVIFIYDRLFLSSSFKQALKKHIVFYSGIFCVFLIPLSYLILVGKISHYWAYIFGRHGVDPWQYLMSQSEVVLHYIKLSVIPWGLCFDYDWQLPTSILSTIPALACWVIIFALLIDLSRRNVFLAFPLWFFILNLLPRSLVSSTHAAVEYRMYLPLAGLVIFYVIFGFWLIKRFAAKNRDLQKFFWFITPVVIVLIFSLITISRNRVYDSKLALWKDTAQKAPHNFRAWNYYGIALSENKEFDKAEECFQRALTIFPGNFMALNNLANNCVERGDLDNAILLYYQSLKSKNDRKELIRKLNSTTHQNLAKIFLMKNDFPKAIFHYNEAIRLTPQNASLLYELGKIFYRIGEKNVAENYFLQALELDNKLYYVMNDIGLIYLSESKFDKAEEYFRKAVSIKPDFFPAKLNLELIYKQRQKK